MATRKARRRSRAIRTAKQKAALRKAQLASARKRKKGVKRATRRSVSADRKVYGLKHYTGAGGLHRNIRDATAGRGAYAIGRKKKVSKTRRRVNRVATGVFYTSQAGSLLGVAHGVSYARQLRANKKRKRR